MKNKLGIVLSAVCLGLLLGMSGISIHAEASDGEEYITISVDAMDDKSGLMYALDTDDPNAFTTNNEFRVLAGTSHTIYVKDSAGNITSQSYDVEDTGKTKTETGSSSTGTEKDKYYDYLTDTPAEEGEGTIYDKLTTDGSDTAEKVFYTITTAEGDTFYLVMDQNRGADNVYLLNQVTNSELKSLAVDDTGIQEEKENEQNLLEQLKETPEEELPEAEKETESSNGELMKKLIIFALIGGGLYYYFKVYKKKKNTEMEVIDAKDMDEFEAEDDDEVFFNDEYTEEEKEQFLQELVESDDEFFGDDELEEETEGEEDDDSEELLTTEKIVEDENCDVAILEASDEAGFLEEDMEYDPELDGEEEE